MRQIYAAILITLSGNYYNGSIGMDKWQQNNDPKGKCKYKQQFNDKFCGKHQLKYDAKICNNSIQLNSVLDTSFPLDSCINRNNNTNAIFLYSVGNHQLGRDRFGVNDPIEYINLFNNNMCKRLKDNSIISEINNGIFM